MTKENIAQIAHEINRAYCASLGDGSQPEWKDAPDWQKDSAMKGVTLHLNNPDTDPASSHQRWLEIKRKEGWVYGEIKDPDKKTHPCMLDYYELPASQQAKDFIFRQVVHSLAPYVLPVLTPYRTSV